jgi:AcrR family transcriptional regulator
MNHVPMKVLSVGASAMRPTRRALAKQRTREKILAAARALFTERGYEGATIRDIAGAAGMSTGAVFASFADKAELFEAILAADCQTLEGAMADAAQGDGPVLEALSRLIAVAYGFSLRQLPLVQAALSISWTRDPQTELRIREVVMPLLGLVDGVLRAGVERGELSPQADLVLIRDMLWQAHLSGYRAAVYDGLTAQALTARFGEQAQVILAGVRA